MMIHMKRFTLVVFFLAAGIAKATSLPQSFTYQGTLTDASDIPISSATTVIFRILNSVQDCILYSESQPVSPDANGNFLVQIGSFAGSPKRTVEDSNNSMTAVFQNSTAIAGIKVSDGTICMYSPASGQLRHLQIQVNSSILSPNVAITSVPFATVAETVQGLAPSNILQVNTSGATALSQANLNAAFTTPAYTNLQDILGGNYVKTSALPTCAGSAVLKYDGTNFSCVTPSGGSGTVTNVTGTLPISVTTGTSTPVISIATANTTTTGALTATDFTTFNSKLSPTLASANIFVGNASNIATGVALSGDAIINNAGILSLNNIVTANTFSKITFNAKGQVTGGAALMSSDITTALGYTPGSGSGTVIGVTAAATSGNPIIVSNSSTLPSIDIYRATASVNGYLASSDFSTFNSKQAGSTELTGLAALSSVGFVRRTAANIYTSIASIDLTTSVIGLLPSANIASNAITSAQIVNATITSSDLSSASIEAINLAQMGASTGQVMKWTGSAWVASADLSSNAGTVTGATAAATAGNPITVSNSSTSPSIDISRATASANGYLASSDWSIFNSKLSNFSTLTSADVTTALTFTPVSRTLSSANIFVGNASNIATGVVLSGDATINDSGILSLRNIVAANTFSKITYNAKGQVTGGAALISSDITTALGYTPGSNSGTVTGATAAATTGNPITVSNSSTSPSIDISRATASVNGYLASSDFTNFNNKLGSALTAGSIFIGNGSNIAQAQTISGDATITNAGLLTVGTGAITSAKILNATISSADLSTSIANALWSVNGSGDVSRISGNVGIGTTSPQSLFHMSGSDTSGTGINGLIENTATTGFPSAGFQFKAAGVTQGYVSGNNYTDLFFGIMPGLNLMAGSNFQDITFSTGAAVAGGASGPTMVIKSSGNVGIGTTAPQTTLDVNGTAGVGSTYEGMASYVNSSTAYTIPNTSLTVYRITLTGNSTITLPAFTTASTAKIYSMTIFLKQDGTGFRTIAWAQNGSDTIKWDTGTAPTISPTAGKITIIQLMKPSDETVWYGSMVWKED